MLRRLAVVLATAVIAVALAPASRAQETPKPEMLKPDPGPVKALLRVQIAIARYQGERKVSSVPYAMLVTSDGRKVRLRMGVEVPITVTKVSASEGPPVSSFQYRNVGTNIDCWAEERGSGLYQLSLNIEASSIFPSPGGESGVGVSEAGFSPDRPLFRTFNVGLNPTMRDGQTLQTVASTDPVTGEVVKIDVTLNVVK